MKKLATTIQLLRLPRSALALLQSSSALKSIKKAQSSNVRSWSSYALKPLPYQVHSFQLRWFETEADYHEIADATLDTIQDSIDDVFDKTSIEYEVSLASGVLTFSLPPHGTWVINKQTPNRQLWWSSPLSGPKRYEYDDDDQLWFSTKDGLTLGPFLVQEIRHFHPELEEWELDV